MSWQPMHHAARHSLELALEEQQEKLAKLNERIMTVAWIETPKNDLKLLKLGNQAYETEQQIERLERLLMGMAE